MSDSTNGKFLTLICERSCDLNAHIDEKNMLKDVPAVRVVKFPCSGMIQPLMVEAAFKAGAQGVIITGCQLGDCYYREGNRMIRERMLGERPPGLKKTVDRRRVIGLWLSRPQTSRFLSEAKEFVAMVEALGPVAVEPAKPAPAKPAAPAAPKPEAKETTKTDAKDEAKAETKPEAKAEIKSDSEPMPEAKTESKKEAKKDSKSDLKSESKEETKAEETKEGMADAKPEAKDDKKKEDK